MERMKILPEIEYAIDVAMAVMRDTWDDKEMDLEEFKSGVLGNAEVIKKACEFMIEWAENYQEIYNKELFKFEYDTEMYSGEPIKYIGIDELTAKNGFIMDEVNELKNLELKESIVIDNGFVKVTRVR